MGYDLHITRREDWADEGPNAITQEEWAAYISASPTLRPAGDELNPLMAICECSSAHEDPWLDWSDGNLSTKNPDEPLIRFMIQVARDLDARVQGDEGEEYLLGSDGRVACLFEGVQRPLDEWFPD